MAIGLARLFGFQLLENFNRPYAAVGITDFWRRWHISLSRWFRDYLYIPLGGNRSGRLKTYRNLMVVFALCGLWHGAHWTFVCWGLYHGCLLIMERVTGLRRMPEQRWTGLRRLATFVFVVFGWVLFRADTLPEAMAFAKVMVVPFNLPLSFELYTVLHLRNITFLALAAAATLGAHRLPTFESLMGHRGPLRTALSFVYVFVVLPYCAMFITAGTSNPFIYFRF
jgi:alginate O-acetyltransferase complex protein AlgI